MHPTLTTLHPTPTTHHPTPTTLHPTPCTLHPTPYILDTNRHFPPPKGDKGGTLQFTTAPNNQPEKYVSLFVPKTTKNEPFRFPWMGTGTPSVPFISLTRIQWYNTIRARHIKYRPQTTTCNRPLQQQLMETHYTMHTRCAHILRTLTHHVHTPRAH